MGKGGGGDLGLGQGSTGSGRALTNASARAAEFVAALAKTGPTVGSGLGHLVATWIA